MSQTSKEKVVNMPQRTSMESALVNVPQEKRRSFSKHFLNSVHCELAFASIDPTKIFEQESHFKNKFSEFGFQESKKVTEGHFLLQIEEGGTRVEQNAKPIGLLFLSQKPRRELQVTKEKIIISEYSYDGFEPFLERLKSYVDIVEDSLGKRDVVKTGLRKINSIIADPVSSYADACSIFNPALFGTLRGGLPTEGALKGSEEVLVIEQGKQTCLLRTRFRKLDKPNAYEANLDFDLIDKNINRSDVVLNTLLTELNNTHFNLFMWAVTSELIQLMEQS